MKLSPMYPRLSASAGKSRSVSLAGGLLLTEAVRASGLGQAMSQALMPWRKPLAELDPGKILTDVAVAVAAGGECLSDAGLLRCEPGVYGKVASEATISRRFALLGEAPHLAEKAVAEALAGARARVWALDGYAAPHATASVCDPLVVDLDATLVTAHSDKERAAPTFKHGYGFHPLLAFADHGWPGSGEPLSHKLRPGNAGSNTAADHITVTRAALKALPVPVSKKVLVRADGAGGTQDFTKWLTGRGVQYSVGCYSRSEPGWKPSTGAAKTPNSASAPTSPWPPTPTTSTCASTQPPDDCATKRSSPKSSSPKTGTSNTPSKTRTKLSCSQRTGCAPTTGNAPNSYTQTSTSTRPYPQTSPGTGLERRTYGVPRCARQQTSIASAMRASSNCSRLNRLWSIARDSNEPPMLHIGLAWRDKPPMPKQCGPYETKFQPCPMS